MNIECILQGEFRLPAVLKKLCELYLEPIECIYYNRKWNQFSKFDICNIAAKYNWLDLLIWAKQKNCPWGFITCDIAIHYGHLDILEWAKQNNCPWSVANALKSKSIGYNTRSEAREWIKQYKYQLDKWSSYYKNKSSSAYVVDDDVRNYYDDTKQAIINSINVDQHLYLVLDSLFLAERNLHLVEQCLPLDDQCLPLAESIIIDNDTNTITS